MQERFVFRQVDHRDIRTFLQDGAIRSKNFIPPQQCHQTSYGNLVDRRGTELFTLPGGGVVNDYVAFYFSPATSFTFAIHRGNVPVRGPDGSDMGMSKLADRVFVVCKLSTMIKSGLPCCFSNYALNSNALLPTISNDLGLVEQEIDWSMFDDEPLTAQIQEIGYAGVCRWFHSRAEARYLQRKEKRMAEFLVHESLPMALIECFVVANEEKKVYVQREVQASDWKIDVYSKPGCFLS